MSSPKPTPFWSRDRHRDRRPFLLARAQIVAALRRWFEAEGFLIVEPAALQVSPGNEAHLHAFSTELVGPDGARALRYLHTSPEFAMKKLLAAGEERIAAFAPVYRNRERSPLHAPEFTMVEWYRVGAAYTAVMADTAALVAEAARAAGSATLSFRGRMADPFAVPERLTVAKAFSRWAGIDLLAVTHSRDRLASGAVAAGVRVADDDTWSDIFSRVLSEKIEPNLGAGAPTLLHEYPAEEAALARISPRDPRVAERFELYACGVELANGFAELTDPPEQRRRLAAEMDEKARVYGDRYPLDEDFLAALAEMPEASGVALGLDRLVMLLTGAPRIDLVQWTPVETGEETR
ncbi:MAG TPA: EF-P lysine aminoacylase EpmA [Bauldia sp.]|nr:EF-P lysine aminoacylase EpmA [Bauldia sp.]